MVRMESADLDLSALRDHLAPLARQVRRAFQALRETLARLVREVRAAFPVRPVTVARLDPGVLRVNQARLGLPAPPALRGHQDHRVLRVRRVGPPVRRGTRSSR